MHNLDATRIFWKEWRAQRSFWLGLLGLAIGLEILLTFGVPLLRPTNAFEQFRFHQGLVVVLACSFATGSAAIAFAGEVEAKTKGLLQQVPVRARDLLAGKLTFSLAGSYSLFVALWLLGSFMLSESWAVATSRSIRIAMAEGASQRDLDEIRIRGAVQVKPEDSAIGNRAFLENLPGPLAFVVVGSLFSLILSDVLLTVLIAGVSTAALLAIPVVRENPVVQCALIAVAVVCDFALTRRWLIDAGAARWRLVPTLSFPRPVLHWRRLSAEHSRTLESTRSAVAWRRAAGSLIWKEFRQAWPLCLAILLIGLGAIVLTRFYDHSSWGYGAADIISCLMLVTPLLPGVAAVRAERRGRAFQLLAHHGVAADGFLLCKHLVWLVLSLATFVTILLADGTLCSFVQSAGAPRHSLWVWASHAAQATFGSPTASMGAALTVGCVHVLLLYALGFLLALLLPGTIVALFAGFLIEFGVFLVWSTVAEYQIPFWSTIGPLPLVLLAVAWVRASDWLTERNSAWWKVAAVLFVPLGAMLGATAVTRVTEIPAVSVPEAVFESDSPSGLIQHSGGKQSLFVDAMHAMIGKPPAYFSTNDVVLENGWQFVTPAEREWIEKNSAHGNWPLKRPEMSRRLFRACHNATSTISAKRRRLTKG